MMRRYSYLLLLVPVAMQAQPQLPPFWPVDTIPCPYDANISILGYAGWEAYQTSDDHWAGPRDSTYCIGLAFQQGNFAYPGIDLDQTDRTRPVFVRVLLDSTNAIPLEQNNQYSISMWAYLNTGFDVSDTCPDGFCTGILASVRIPDEWSPGFDQRWYTSGYAEDPWGDSPLHLCIPTEKFEQNDLREVVISLKPASIALGQKISLSDPIVDDLSWIGTLLPITETTAPQYYWSSAYHFDDQSWMSNYLVLHPDTTYPSADNIGHVDLAPIPNGPQPTIVPVHLYPYTGFNFQPFTQLRGALVEGSDSVRHSLEVINDGADLCLTYQFVEVIWEPGNSYVHNSGHLDFQGKSSCFMFMPGSTLEVGPNSIFQYGRNGRGMLALRQGSKVELRPGSELEIHGMLVLLDAIGATDRSDQHITLSHGARLSFAPGSSIHNGHSLQQDMKLIVTLDGGSIDINGLRPEDREKVIVITLPAEHLTDIRTLGNPAQDVLALQFSSREAGSMRLRAIDAMGRSAGETTMAVHTGENLLHLPIDHYAIGVYILEAMMNGQRQVLRFVHE